MDLSDPKVWTDGARVIIEAPHIVVPLLGLALLATWWFRGTIEKGSKDALKERVGSLEERLRLSQERESDVHAKLETVQTELNKIQYHLPQNAGKELANSATAASTAVSGALSVLESLYPNVRVADNPQVIKLFSGPKRAKLLSLLGEEVIYAWARRMTGSTDFVRIAGKDWEKFEFAFAPKSSDPRSINQTFLRKTVTSSAAYCDLCLNSTQLLRAFPSLQIEKSDCDVL